MVNPNMIQGNPQNPRMGLPQMNPQQQPRPTMMQNMQPGVNPNLMGQNPQQVQQQGQPQQLVPPPPYPEPPPPYPGQVTSQGQVSELKQLFLLKMK